VRFCATSLVQSNACVVASILDSISLGAVAVDNRVDFPTSEQVEKATRDDLARWYRFLLPNGKEQQAILDKIADRFKKLGGMTPELSKRIGHGGA